jgi:hypothetical protein
MDWGHAQVVESLLCKYKALSSNFSPTKEKKRKRKKKVSQVPVAHTCNPSYSGGRDQEDGSSKPAQADSSQDPISKNASQKKKG